MRFLEERLSGDALAVAIDAAWAIFRSFASHDGVPPGRLTEALLSRAEQAALTESYAGSVVPDGCAVRQPALVQWVADLVVEPPVPLEPIECWDIMLCLCAVIYGFDQLTTGRSVP